MLRESLRSKLDSMSPISGLILKMPCQSLIAMAGHVGFDFVLIDTEHGPSDDSLLENHILAAKSVGLSSIVRVGKNDSLLILKALDSGADGVAIPHVSDQKQADKASEATFYPPKGKRGLAVSTVAGGFGSKKLDQHVSDSNRDSVLLIQIEDTKGVENLNSILSNSDIDGVWIGPTDLASSLGVVGQPEDLKMQKAIDSIRETTLDKKRHLCVIADSQEEAQSWTELGATIILFNGINLIRDSFKRVLGK